MSTVTTASTNEASRGGVAKSRGLFDREILGQAFRDAFRKLDPRVQIKNPVMFVVLIGTVVVFIEAIGKASMFAWSITVWLFLTCLLYTSDAADE